MIFPQMICWHAIMFRVPSFHDLVSGRRRGLFAAVFRGILVLFEVPYRLAVAWRNRRYNRGRAAILRAGLPVISVGNLTLGGTGKTPLVRWIVRHLQDHGWRAAVVSRGYGAARDGRNDEALELEATFPGIVHLQNRDRVAAAHDAAARYPLDVLVLDDGFQHRRLARDLDLVLLDALAPFGYGHVFPRGLLRESVGSLARADGVVLSRADLVDADTRSKIQREVEQLAPGAFWCEVAHAPQYLINASGTRAAWTSARQGPVAAFCGIGNSAGFRQTLDLCGIEVPLWQTFPDHYAYPADMLPGLTTWANTAGIVAILCTQKDLVKIGRDRLGELPLWAVAIEIEFHAGLEAMVNAIHGILKSPE